MKIGDEVYIHGYVDEIRQNVVIIRNDGGYFGTVAEEITSRSEKPNTCSDAISRADARYLIAETNRNALGYISTKVFKILYDGIDNLPSVTPQQRTGRWFYDKVDMNGYYLDNYECSVCKCSKTVDTPYCPMCGAKMEVQE